MKNWSKVWITIVCAVCLVTASVSATLAVLMVRTETVENTFTVGKIDLTLDESAVDELGTPIDGADRVKSNKYKLFSGGNYAKDPVVYVGGGSESCYVFVKVENGIEAIEDQEGTTIAEQILANGWTLMEDVYYKTYETTENDVEYAVFQEFTIGDFSVGELAAYEKEKITITAYAVQSEGIDNPADAWSMAYTKYAD